MALDLYDDIQDSFAPLLEFDPCPCMGTDKGCSECSGTGIMTRAEPVPQAGDEFSSWVGSMGRVIKTLDAEAKVIEEHGQRMLAKSATRRNRCDYLKQMLLQALMEYGRKDKKTGNAKYKDAVVTVYTQKNPPSVEVITTSKVPEEYRRMQMKYMTPQEVRDYELQMYVAEEEVMKSKIVDHFKETGEVVNGVEIHTDNRHVRVI